MKSKIFRFLKEYTTEPLQVDRLIVSAFLRFNLIYDVKNILVKEYIIQEDEKEDFLKLIEFIQILKTELIEFKIENLIELFEFVISPADRKINGAVYTPLFIRDYIITQAFTKKQNSINRFKVADISCGCGGFLYNSAKKIKDKTDKTYFQIFKSQIFGLDIQKYSVDRTKILLSLTALIEGEDRKIFKFNLFTGDALIFDWTTTLNHFSGFDIIVGNPPYVCSRKLTLETKIKLKKWEVSNSGHPDLYIPFFQIGIENLAVDGFLGFVTMNSFFKSLNGRNLREYFKKNILDVSIIDFGTEQIFKSKNTYTCLCFITKRTSEFVRYFKPKNSKNLSSNTKFKSIEYLKLDSKNGWNLQNHEIISKIESCGIPLGQLYKTRNGIATLKNDIYIFNPIKEDDKFYYLQNGKIFPIEKGICRDIFNSNKLNSSLSLKKKSQKVIFPYSHSQKPELLKEVLFKKEFPKAYQYLKENKEILNGRDNGEGEYENWFAFGRTQSLGKMKYKLFFPHFADKTPNYLINSDENLLFYNGLALIGESRDELRLIKKIMESKIFWFYVQNTSKPYTSGYFSFSSNYIRNFGICKLDQSEIKFVLAEEDKEILDTFFGKKYNVKV